jgi:hypothetical protein
VAKVGDGFAPNGWGSTVPARMSNLVMRSELLETRSTGRALRDITGQ